MTPKHVWTPSPVSMLIAFETVGIPGKNAVLFATLNRGKGWSDTQRGVLFNFVWDCIPKQNSTSFQLLRTIVRLAANFPNLPWTECMAFVFSMAWHKTGIQSSMVYYVISHFSPVCCWHHTHLTLYIPIETTIQLLLTISLVHQAYRAWEYRKWSPELMFM